MPLISVIVPVYNVEKFIEKSLLSIRGQTFKDFECIIVDDGSQDDSVRIAADVISGDARFRIVSKPNGGLSDARNFGLSISKAEYICFQDSDDYYSFDFLEKMYFNAISNIADVVVCDTCFVKESGEIIKYHDNNIKNAISGIDAFIDVTISKNILCITQNKLFKKCIFHKISYPLNLYYEDRATTYKLFLASEKVSFVNERLFFYVQRDGSITNTLNKKNISDRLLVMQTINDFFEDNNLMSIYKNEYLICYLLNVYLAGASMIVKNSGVNKKWFDFLFEISDKKKFTFSNIFKTRRTSTKKMLALLILKIDYRIFGIFYKLYFK